MAMQSKYDHPTSTYPYKIARRLNLLSVPRRTFYQSMEGMPSYTERGIRKSALRATPNDRVNDIAWPWVKRLIMLKKLYKNRFSPERLERIERMIESANATMYSKIANCVLDLKKQEGAKDLKKKKGWSESEWKKHMDYISQVARPKKTFLPPPIKRGKSMPLEALMPRIIEISSMPPFKCYIRESQDTWYRDPIKVPPKALKYVITERVTKLAAPRVLNEYY
ncbi:hypothetical protein PYW07_010102 [Mythimna separata]|uniref:Uncharacterized protein n=1 Tax=Mythimna separata TaxID=271217 RepID=A0AAD7YGW4_MYTSE|nr:hypothetical protein PYW07_010102 [Mythimna separata]